MKLANHIALGMLILLCSGLASWSAAAETKLSDFNGSWQGSGNDRNSPIELMQRTNCEATVNADLRRMSTTIVCNGEAGLTKVIQLTITLVGDSLSGNLTQRAMTRGNNSSASILDGSVSGHKTNNTANFQIHFSGLVPNVEVTLKLNNSSSFSMQASTLVGELMDVTFNRTDKP